jgi:hypothetical protein
MNKFPNKRFSKIFVISTVVLVVCSLFFFSFYNSLVKSAFPKSNPGKVAVIGASGYIGSSLVRYLRSIHSLHVDGFDRNPKTFDVLHLASHQIRVEVLRQYTIIVYLGGLTGRKICDER